jgi:DNA modification methylase
VAAARWGRNSIGFEVDEHYFSMAERRIRDDTTGLFSAVEIRVHRG